MSNSPDPTWCAYHQAQFRFFPEPGISPEEVRAGLVRRCESVIERHGLAAHVKEEHDWAVACFGETWKLHLNAENGEFWLTDLDIDDWNIDGPLGRPAKFVRDLNRFCRSKLSDDAFRAVSDLANGLLLLGRSQFETALRRGWARIMARPNSLFSDFSPVPLDVWSAFEVHPRDDWREPKDYVFDAKGPDDAKLYSVFVAPDMQAKSQAAKSTSGAQKRCHRALVRIMLNSPDVPVATRAVLQKQAMSKFKNLSGAAFDRAWRDAVVETGAQWSNPGRRRRNPKSETPDWENP